MRLIELTLASNNKKIYINPECIYMIEPKLDQTTIIISFLREGNNFIKVKESVDTIVNMIYYTTYHYWDTELPSI